jgi:hypothetical protein
MKYIEYREFVKRGEENKTRILVFEARVESLTDFLIPTSTYQLPTSNDTGG